MASVAQCLVITSLYTSLFLAAWVTSMLTPHHLKSFSVHLSTRPLTPAVTFSRVSTIHQHHYDVDMVAERCVLGDTRWVATWRWQLRVSQRRAQTWALRRSEPLPKRMRWQQPRNSSTSWWWTWEDQHWQWSEESQTWTEHWHGERCSRDTHQTQRREYRASRAQSSIQRLSLRAHSLRDRTGRMAREQSRMGIDFWRPFQRVNEESSLSWQSTFIGTSPTSDGKLGYFRGDDGSDSSIPATQRTVSGRCDSDTEQQKETRWNGDRCLDEEGQRQKQGKEQNWCVGYELLRVRTCWPHGQRLLVQGYEQRQRTQQQGQERQRQRQREEQCERSHNSDRVDDDSTGWKLHQSNLENHSGWHLGPSCHHGWGWGRRIRNWIHLGSDPTQGNIHTIQRLACCARFGGQLRRWACVLSARLRVDRHWAKQEFSPGIGEQTQTETLRWAGSSDETSRWTQNLDHISRMWSQRTHHACGQVLPRETIDAPRSRHVVVSCGTKKLKRLWWTEFETTTSWNAGSNQETCWLRCELAAPLEVQVNLRNIVC